MAKLRFFKQNSEPTGERLVVGSIWFNTSNKTIEVYTGQDTGWEMYASNLTDATLDKTNQKLTISKADGTSIVLDFYDIANLSRVQESLTHSELVTLRNNSQLIPGRKYRITDYTIRRDFEGTIDNISSEVNYRGCGFRFDIIVTASSNNSLYEEAQAVEHEYLEGETPNSNEWDYSKWKLRYTIDNDNPKYSWSDSLGKGVIYEMEDEYGNICPYDFKNIRFETDVDIYFTFEGQGLLGNYYNNIIKPWIVNGVQYLNAIIITTNQCFNNVFEANCRDIKQLVTGGEFVNNVFQNTCHTATIGDNVKNIVMSANCSNWSIGNNCHTLNIGTNNDRWSVGDNSHNITTGSLNSDWTVGRYCMYITTGNHTWSWGCQDYTSSWTAGDSCIGFTIGSGYTRIEEDFVDYESENINVTIETGAEYFNCIGLTNGIVPSSIKGILGYPVTLTSLYNLTDYIKKGGETPELIEIRYSEFVNKRSTRTLIPGKQYLISDYCTFYYKDQYPNMSEVNTTIPIIVTADSKNMISPYARLANGSAEIHINLYLDYRFPQGDAYYVYEGTKCSIEDSSNVVTYNGVEYTELYLKVLDSDDLYYYTYVVKTEWEEMIAKPIYTPLGNGYQIQAYLVYINGVAGQKGLRFDPTDTTQTLVAFQGTHRYYPEIPYSRGMGEITWMKDASGNEAPFDFKSARWYFTEEEINNFDNSVYENGKLITGLAQYFTPNTATPTFSGECKNNVIIFNYGIGPVIVQGSHDNKIIIEGTQYITLVNNSYYSELHSQSTTNIYPFLQQQYCYTTVYNGVLRSTPYKPVDELGNSGSLTVSQKTITEKFNSIDSEISSIRNEEKPTLIEVTYEELFDLYHSGNLIQGMKYRCNYSYYKWIYDDNNLFPIDEWGRNYNIIFTANSKRSFEGQIIINSRYKSLVTYNKYYSFAYKFKKNTLRAGGLKYEYEYPADTLYDYENDYIDVDILGNGDYYSFAEIKIPDNSSDPSLIDTYNYFYIPADYYGDVSDIFCASNQTVAVQFPQYIDGENTLIRCGYVNFREEDLFPSLIDSFKNIYDIRDIVLFKDETSFYLSLNKNNNNVIVNSTYTTISNCKNSIINVSGDYQDLQNCIVEKDTNGDTKVYSIVHQSKPTTGNDAGGEGSLVTGVIIDSLGHVVSTEKGDLEGGGSAPDGQYVKGVTVSGKTVTIVTNNFPKIDNASQADNASTAEVASKVANKITFTGNQSNSYDGSEAVNVEIPSGYTGTPIMDGTADPGTSTSWAKGDHVHPSDTSKLDASTFEAFMNDRLIDIAKSYVRRFVNESVTILASTHGCGTYPIVQVLDSSGVVDYTCNIQIDSGGSVTVTKDGGTNMTIIIKGENSVAPTNLPVRVIIPPVIMT